MTDNDSDTTDERTDPLADAEPGETVTIEREFEWLPWYCWDAEDWVGRDREIESRLELVATEDTGEQGNETLHATYRAEVTKVGVDEPLGAPEREPTENRWLRRIGAHLAAATATSALAGAVFWALPPFELIINGETAVVATDPMLAVTLWVVFSLAVVVGHGIQGGFPRIDGGRA